MTVYDQFETEPFVFYSGSMADNIMFGSIFANDDENNRNQVSSGVSGIISSSFYSKLMSRNERLDYIRSRKRPKPFITLTSDAEVFQDSILPAPAEIIQTNGVDIPYMSASIPGLTPYGYHGIKTGATSNAYRDRPEQTNNSVNIFFSGIGQPISLDNIVIPFVNSLIDTSWISSFPFQSRYKGLRKVPIKYNLSTPIKMSKDINSNTLYDSILSQEIGNVNLVLPFPSSLFAYPQYLAENIHMWSAASTVTLNNQLTLEHVPSTLYTQGIFVCFNPFPASTETTTVGNYSMFGAFGSISTSPDGINWTRIQGQNSNTRTGTIKVTGWPTPLNGSGIFKLPSYSYAVPVGYNGRKHWKWVLIAGYEYGGTGNGLTGDNRGRVLIETTGPGKPQITSTTNFTDKQSVLATGLGISQDNIDVHGVLVLRDLDGNPSTPYSSPFDGPTDSLCFFGRRLDTSPSPKSLIFFTNRNISNALVGSASTQIDNYVWTDAVKIFGSAIVWFIGTVTGGADKKIRTGGCVGVLASSTTPNAPSAALTDRTATAATAWGSSPLPTCWGIDTDTGSRTIIVGDSGMILRCTSLDGASGWTKRTPAGGFTGSFSSVKWISGTGGSSSWIIVGDGGEVQVSTDGGENWTKAKTEEPNTHRAFSEQRWITDKSASPPIPAISKRDVAMVVPQYSFNTSHRNIITKCRELKESPGSGLPELGRFVSIGGQVINEVGLPTSAGGSKEGFLIIKIVDALSVANNNVLERLNSKVSTYSLNPNVRPNFSTTNKYFFGFGDGIKIDLSDTQYDGTYISTSSIGKLGNITNFTYYDMYGAPSLAQVNAHQVEIRGYRYGASFHEPQQTSCIYRYGKYGQLRDMLEQRPYTKFNVNNTTQEAAVSITFVSGTVDYQQALDYVTASNPSYDPRDSGFWDYEYRSGQPFYDIANID